MDLLGINPVLLIASLMVSATPILLAAIGETVVEKSGVLNLGVEGMMIVGAVVGFITAVNTENPGNWICNGCNRGRVIINNFRGPRPVFEIKPSGDRPWAYVGGFRGISTVG
jgi:hypothetical protein